MKKKKKEEKDGRGCGAHSCTALVSIMPSYSIMSSHTQQKSVHTAVYRGKIYTALTVEKPVCGATTTFLNIFCTIGTPSVIPYYVG